MFSLTHAFLVLCVDPDSRGARSSRRGRTRQLRSMPDRGYLDDLEDQETVELEVMHVQIGRLTDIGVIDSVKVRELITGLYKCLHVIIC